MQNDHRREGVKSFAMGQSVVRTFAVVFHMYSDTLCELTAGANAATKRSGDVKTSDLRRVETAE